MYALIDGNNFYVSCERVFQPRLEGRPVIVLSNNDGCAISRSNEAKDIGIRMGAPWHEIRHMAQTHGLVALSANFALYGDMSDRMMSVLEDFGARQEIYSIDECFVDLSGVPGDLADSGQAMRQRVLQWLGLPCSIGIGPTKTLAKFANHIAKTAERKPEPYPARHARVCNLAALDRAEIDALLAATDAGGVWGVGWRLRDQLRDAGVHTALDLACLDPVQVQRRWSVVLERTVRELQGRPCVDLEDGPQDRRHIAVTRSFGRKIGALADLREAVTVFATRAAEKLRRQRSVAGQVYVYIRTGHYERVHPYSRGHTIELQRPTNDTALIVRAALATLQGLYKAGHPYAKAGVVLMSLQREGLRQGELDLGDAPAPRPRLVQVLDQLNQRYGQDTVFLASAGLGGRARRWSMKQEHRTPRYTTSVGELLEVQA
ncbi:MAG: Y-family DNA polymerase [Hylemonella sp.]